MKEQLPIFVYGTLRPRGSNYYIIESWVRDVQSAEMAGLQLWNLGPYPMACEGVGRVRGELLTLERTCHKEALARIDQLEGVDPATPTRPGRINYWRARRIALLPAAGAPHPEAWVYLGDIKHARQGTRILTGDWWEAANPTR
ncbi:MAG: gamma-glutamylcyclotransferase [Chloroflexota bacterium]|nr:gamma-glutamylcyclotransferase [Chloroflexota bacterium]